MTFERFMRAILTAIPYIGSPLEQIIFGTKDDEDISKIDIISLRKDLINLIGPATPIEEYAQADLVGAETCSDYELVAMAMEYGLDLNNYVKFTR